MSFGILVFPDGHTTGVSFVYICKPFLLFHSPTYISKKRFFVFVVVADDVVCSLSRLQ